MSDCLEIIDFRTCDIYLFDSVLQLAKNGIIRENRGLLPFFLFVDPLLCSVNSVDCFSGWVVDIGLFGCPCDCIT